MSQTLRLTRYIPHPPHPPQVAFLLCDELEAIYGGAAGGGKSDALLMAALQYVDQPDYGALILRRTFAQLNQNDAIMERSKQWLANTDARWNGEDHRWTFPSGATLTFGHCKDEESKYNYQGGQWHFIGFDELTQFTETQYLYIAFSRGRTLESSTIPLRIRSTSNPGGIGHGWVKKRLIKPSSRVAGSLFIPAKIDDNPTIKREQYVSQLSHLGAELRAQLLDGDWDVFEGMAFPDFDEETHVVQPFEIPADWRRLESMDFGVAHPSCVLAWASDYDGNLVVFDEFYANGLVSGQAAELLKRREWWWPVSEGKKPSPVTYADPSMWARTGGTTSWGEPASDVTEFREHGVGGFVKANNDRMAGRVRLLELMRPDPSRWFPKWHPRYGEQGSPRLFVVGSRCPELVAQLKVAPLLGMDAAQTGAGEIIDPGWESRDGHATAAARYGAISWPSPSKEAEQPLDDPRAELMRLNEKAFLARHSADGGRYVSV